MAANKLQWRRIAKGDKLPCQSFLRKKNGEILKLSTGAGVTVGQDAYYLPVDDVIEEIRNYPIEESEDEKMRKELFERFSHIKGFDWYGLPIKDILSWLKEQCEQKPADETKFKVGDWVVYCNDDVDLITGIEKNGYSINNSGYIPFVRASDVRLWTIQDAKDGDVLVSESNCGLGTWYCIFKSLDDDESMTVYCYLTRDGRFETKKELCFDKATYNTKPATKEQRNTLLKAMADAGYTFDFEKKELKKIEQNPAWSEEDEKVLDNILYILNQLKDTTPHKEDETAKECIDKLKSLKDRFTWKPSDEQMEALEHFIVYHNGSTNYAKDLEELRLQLKKLREEDV